MLRSDTGVFIQSSKCLGRKSREFCLGCMGLIRSKHRLHNRHLRDQSKQYYNRIQGTPNTKGYVAVHSPRKGSFPAQKAFQVHTCFHLEWTKHLDQENVSSVLIFLFEVSLTRSCRFFSEINLAVIWCALKWNCEMEHANKMELHAHREKKKNIIYTKACSACLCRF